MLVMSTTIASPAKPQMIVPRDEVVFRLAAEPIKAIKPALLPPLRNPVTMAIAIAFQESLKRRKTNTFVLLYR